MLIVDDDMAFAASLERVCRFAGLDAVSVSNGLEALSLLHIRRPKLIVLDLDMPGMDGLTVLRAIRKDAAYKSVPILIFTADFSELQQKLTIEAGAQDYIVKGTVGWNGLIARIREWLGDGDPRLRLIQ